MAVEFWPAINNFVFSYERHLRLLHVWKISYELKSAFSRERAHYRKLRAQYKRFLEEDRKRQERNERLIRHLERIETRIAMLSAKTERINQLRRQYQGFFTPNCLPEPRTTPPDRSNEETIQILNNYLEALSRKGNLEPSANHAAAYADGILSSICSRHYQKDLHLIRKKTRVPNQAEEAEETAPDPETIQIHIEAVEVPKSEPEEVFKVLQEITVAEPFTEPASDKSVPLEQKTLNLVPESLEDNQKSSEQQNPLLEDTLGSTQDLQEIGIEAPSESQPLEEGTNTQNLADEVQELCQQNDEPEPNEQQNGNKEPEIHQKSDKPESEMVDEEPELYQEHVKLEPQDQQNIAGEPEMHQKSDNVEPNVDEEPELYQEDVKPVPDDQENPESHQQIESNDQPFAEDNQTEEIMPQYEETPGYDQYGQLLLYNQLGELVQPRYDETGHILAELDSEGQPLTLYDQNGQQYDHNRQPVVHYDADGLPVYEYYSGEELLQDATQLQGPNEYYPQGEPSGGNERFYSEPHGVEVCEESNVGPQEDPEAETIPEQSAQQNEPEKKLEEGEMGSVMDILDTDTESSKQNVSKVSNDTDFDFSWTSSRAAGQLWLFCRIPECCYRNNKSINTIVTLGGFKTVFDMYYLSSFQNAATRLYHNLRRVATNGKPRPVHRGRLLVPTEFLQLMLQGAQSHLHGGVGARRGVRKLHQLVREFQQRPLQVDFKPHLSSTGGLHNQKVLVVEHRVHVAQASFALVAGWRLTQNTIGCKMYPPNYPK